MKKGNSPTNITDPASGTAAAINTQIFSHMTIDEHAHVQVGNIKVVGKKKKIVYQEQAELPSLVETLQAAQQYRQQANNLDQALHFYMAPEASLLLGSEQRFDLAKEVEQFLAHPEQRLLLMLGDSGAGKSLFTQQLEKQQWKHVQEDEGEQRIPLRIELKQFSGEAVKQCLQKTFAELGYPEEALPALRQQHPFLFILDGYDEIGGQTYFNLYQANHLELWNAKVIITCRTQALPGDHKALFAPHQNTSDTWREIYLAPFSKAAIEQYLARYTAEHPEAVQLADYVKKTPAILPLLSNPFILNLFVQAFSQLAPRLMTDRMTALTRHEIYSAFMQQWFTREEQFLAQKVGLPLGRDVKHDFQDFAQRLALAMFNNNVIEITYKPAGRAAAESQRWEGFFTHQDKHTVQCRRACPLRRIGEHQYSFVHKSFLEYFVAEALWVEIENLPDTTDWVVIEQLSDTTDRLNTRCWKEEPAIVAFLAERLNTESKLNRANYIERLLNVVKSSRENVANSQAATNAITLLNAAHVPFSGMDL